MNFLVPTDFSVCAEHAVQFASLLARRTDHDITLLHVYAPIDLANTAMIDFVEQEIEKAKQELEEKLKITSKLIHEQHNIVCHYKLNEGPLIEIIVEEATLKDCRMIIMGTEGASGLNKLLFGSRTASVIEHTDCPVLAVPPQSSLSLPKKIVFATNFFDSDLKTLEQLLLLVKAWRPEIYLLHVSHDNMRSERDYIEQFSQTVSKVTSYKPVYYYVLPHDSDEKGIELFIKSVGAEMLVLSTRKRNFLERLFNASLTKRIASHLKVPLLAYHMQASDKKEKIS